MSRSSVPELTLRERCEKRLKGLQANRQPYEADWRDIASYAQPARSRWLNSDTNTNKRQSAKRRHDDYGILAFRTTAAGMFSGLSSPSRPWFKLALFDDDLMDDQAAKEWLGEVERGIYGFLDATNFYSAAKALYAELALFGTAAMVIVEDDGPDVGAVFHDLTVGEYWIGLSKRRTPDTLYRRVPMSVAQCVQDFGIDKVSDTVKRQYEDRQYEQTVNVFHAIEPNPEMEPKRLDHRGKAFRSIWWDENDSRKDHLLRESGFNEQPFIAPRWETVGYDSYGVSPGMHVLTSLRELQLQAKRKAEATDLHLYPEIVVDPKVKLRRTPKSVVSAASVDKDSLLVPYQVPYQSVQAIKEDIEQVRRDIADGCYANLFQAITQMEGGNYKNVLEITRRYEEQMTQLGSVIDSVNGALEIALDRVFAIMLRQGRLPEPPESLQGQEIRMDFVSVLTQVQRTSTLAQIERTASFVGNLAALYPDAADKLNIDEMIDQYGEGAGSPAKMIRSTEDAQKIRDQRSQQMQAEKAAAMMPAVQQGADAARLLSETDVGGTPLLDAIMPG